MDMIYRMVVVAGLSLALSGNCFASGPVYLPCHPNCGPIHPCDIAPEKCEDKGGPLYSTDGSAMEQLEQADEDGKEAVKALTEEKAHEEASETFDTPHNSDGD